MRALVVRRPEGPEAIELIDTEIPVPAPGQVRIAVAAAALNPVDLGTASGWLHGSGVAAPHDQYGLGWDVAGTIDAVGNGVDLPVSTSVVGLSDQVGIPLKTHAEYVVLDATAVAVAPRSASPAEASTLPLNGLTALQALERTGLSAGQTLLVTGAAGALGGYAVQLAKQQGLTVVAAASDQDRDLVTGLGADLFVPRSADLNLAVRSEFPQGVDGAIDAAVIGTGALDAVRNHGTFVAVLPPLPPALRGITVHHVLIVADATRLTHLVDLVDAGTLTLRVAGTHPLTAATEAYQRLAKGTLRGRLVLTP